MPKSAIFTTLPGPLVVSKQFRAAMSRWMKRFCSIYLQPFVTSIAHINRSFIVRGDGRSCITHKNSVLITKVKLLGYKYKPFVPPIMGIIYGYYYRPLLFKNL
jgi:hypothetical protein